MSVQSRLRAVALLAIVGLGLVACGNDTAEKERLTLFKSLNPFGAKVAPAAPVDLAQVIPAILATTTEPVYLIAQEGLSRPSAVLRIATNGNHQTFASADRISVILNNGVLTGSRGLGNDLMSSDVSDLLQMLATRSEGQTAREMRYLDGEDATFNMKFTCQVTRGPTGHVQAGEVDAKGVSFIETCTSRFREITNTYVVDSSGRVIQSRQWLSPARGYAVFQPLRL